MSGNGPRYTAFVEFKNTSTRRRDRLAQWREFNLPIDPRKSSVRWIWDVVVWHMFVLISFVVPVEVAFSEAMEGEVAVFFWLNRLFDAFTVCDMVIQSVTALPDPHRPGVYVTDLKKVVCKYVRRSLWLDVLSLVPSLPLSTFFQLTPVEASALYVLRFLRLLRLLRIGIFFDITVQWQLSCGCNNAVLSLTNTLSIILVAAHWLACVWSGAGIEAHTHGIPANWIQALKESKPFTPDLFDDLVAMYSVALYWSVMTLTGIGYGDITPQNIQEYRICAICMLVSGGLWAYTVGEVCGVVTGLLSQDLHLKKRMDELNNLMEEQHVPPDKRKELRRYLFEARKVHQLEEQKAVVQLMSPMLQKEIVGSMMESFRARVSYIRGVRPELMASLARELQAQIFAPKETVPPGKSLCSVRRGIGIRAGRILVVGDVWGEDMILYNEMLRDLTPVRCMSYLEILALKISVLHKVVDLFPDERAALRWAQVKLGIIRAAKLLAAANIMLKRDVGKDFVSLGEGERQEAVKKTLCGNFDASFYATKTPNGTLVDIEQSVVSRKTVLMKFRGQDFADPGPMLSADSEMGSPSSTPAARERASVGDPKYDRLASDVSVLGARMEVLLREVRSIKAVVSSQPVASPQASL